MTSKQQLGSKQPVEAEGTFDFGAAIALGLVLGFAFGTVLGNGPMGGAVGLLLATVANAYQERKQGKKGAGTALAITVGALLVFILIWAASVFGWI